MSNAPVEWRSLGESVTIQIEVKFQVGLRNYSVLRYFLPNQLVAVVVLCVVCEEPPVLSVYFFLVQEFTTALLLSPIVGFFSAGLFAGFAVYFPELFPTAIRATAQGFCYNFARFFSAVAPFITGLLTSSGGSFAHAIGTVGLVYLLGVIILIFARETKGQPLPD